MSIIDEDIKNGKLNHIYLIYGGESFLRKQYKERLKKALSPEEDSMNYSYYEGKDISAGEIIDLAETMPFLAERRTIGKMAFALFYVAFQTFSDTHR